MERLPEFLSQQLPLVLAFVGLTVFLLVGLLGRFTRGYREVTPAELTMLINRENALVVDISAIADFEKAHIPGSLEQPAFRFPFKYGQTWAYTGGPHTAWGEGEPLAAVDFAPGNIASGCTPTDEPATAIADGVKRAEAEQA